MTVRNWGASNYVTLPLAYPSGTLVTVKIDPVPNGLRVSDNGVAYREVESIGAQRSFARRAPIIAEEASLETNRRAIFADIPPEQLTAAIIDVAAASKLIADQIYSRVSESEEAEISGHLHERLIAIFGASHFVADAKLKGSSTNEWEMSAVVHLPNREVVFQAVSGHANSVFRTSTAFHDLGALMKPPTLVAVVRNKQALGPKYSMLAQAGRVIEDSQPDDVFLKAAA